MKVLICVRGGSKGIPKKNIAKFDNSNLLSYSIKKIKSNNNVQKIFVSTDCDEISRIALKEKLEIITTEKDYKRLTNKNKKSIKFLKVELKIENFKKFKNFLKEKI